MSCIICVAIYSLCVFVYVLLRSRCILRCSTARKSDNANKPSHQQFAARAARGPTGRVKARGQVRQLITDKFELVFLLLDLVLDLVVRALGPHLALISVKLLRLEIRCF